MCNKIFKLFAMFLLVFGVFSTSRVVGQEAALPAYQPISGLSGMITSTGSDTMDGLIADWCKAFSGLYPDVNCSSAIVPGRGSSTAPTALINEEVLIGRMSRPMKLDEMKLFLDKYGKPPKLYRVALDSIGVFVNSNNQIDCLTYQEIDSIFSKTRKCGRDSFITSWADLRQEGEIAVNPITAYGRDAKSGTSAIFKERALCGGDYRDDVGIRESSGAIVDDVSNDLHGVGYSGLSKAKSGVRAIAVARSRNRLSCKEPTIANIKSGEYPLSRVLYLYVNPQKAGDPLINEFVKFIFSGDGQKVVTEKGFYSLSNDNIKKELAKLSSGSG